MTATGSQSQNIDSKFGHLHALSLEISSISTHVLIPVPSCHALQQLPPSCFKTPNPDAWSALSAPSAAWDHRAQERPPDSTAAKEIVFPKLYPSVLHELWWVFDSYTNPSDDLALVTYENPLLCLLYPQQFGSVCIYLKAYLYIKVSLFFFYFLLLFLCVFIYASYCWITLEVLLLIF